MTESQFGTFPLVIKDNRSGFFTGESHKHERKYWIHRKEDKLTLACSYMRVYQHKKGTTFSKWVTAFAIIVKTNTIKNGEKRTNVYYTGVNFGARKTFLNITNNHGIYWKSLPEDFIDAFLQELQLLALRNGYITPAELIIHAHLKSSTQIEELLLHMCYPIMKSIYSKQPEIVTVPLNETPRYASRMLRSANREILANYLKLGKKSKEFFVKQNTSFPLETMHVLDLLSGIASDDLQYKILKDISKLQRNSNYLALLWNPETKTAYRSHIREIFKLLPEKELEKLLSDKMAWEYLREALAFWIGLSKGEKQITLDEDIYMPNLAESIHAKLNQNTENTSGLIDEIDEFFATIADGKYIDYRNNHYSRSNVTLNMGNYASYLPTRTARKQKPLKVEVSSTMGKWNPKHPLVKKLLKDKNVISKPLEIERYNDYGAASFNIKDYRYLVTLPSYIEFLHSVLEEAIRRLKSHNIEETQTNVAFSFVMVIFSMQKVKGISLNPRKPYQLYKLGFSDEIIWYSITNKVPLKTIESYSGVPEFWVKEILDIKI